jgi:hypothetical protein
VVIAGREGTAVTMSVRRDPRTGGWFFRTTVKAPDGNRKRLYGTPGVPGPYHDLAATKVGAQEAEQRAIRSAFTSATGAATPPAKKEAPRCGRRRGGPVGDRMPVAPHVMYARRIVIEGSER